MDSRVIRRAPIRAVEAVDEVIHAAAKRSYEAAAIALAEVVSARRSWVATVEAEHVAEGLAAAEDRALAAFNEAKTRLFALTAGVL